MSSESVGFEPWPTPSILHPSLEWWKLHSQEHRAPSPTAPSWRAMVSFQERQDINNFHHAPVTCCRDYILGKYSQKSRFQFFCLDGGSILGEAHGEYWVLDHLNPSLYHFGRSNGRRSKATDQSITLHSTLNAYFSRGINQRKVLHCPHPAPWLIYFTPR